MRPGIQVASPRICGKYLRPRTDGLGLKPLVGDLVLSQESHQRDSVSAAAACLSWVNAMSVDTRKRCTLQRMFPKNSWTRLIVPRGRCHTCTRYCPASRPTNCLRKLL